MKMTIYKKMILGFLAIIAIMIGVNAYLVYTLDSVSTAAHTTLSSDVASINLAKHLRTILYDEELSAGKYAATMDNAYYSLFVEESDRFIEGLDSLVGMQSDPRKFEVLQFARTKHEEFTASFIAGEAKRRADPKPDARMRLDDRELLSFSKIHDVLDRFIRMNQISIDLAMANVELTTRQSARVALWLTVGTLALALMVAFAITRTITRPIAQVIHGTQQIARGSFEQIAVASHDETAVLARAVNDMSTQLKQINEYKASMMRQISHELRTPLQTLLSAQYILTEQKLGRLNTEQLRLLNSMRSNIDKLIRFTNAFLDIAKIEAGKMEYNLVLADLLSIVAASIDDAQVLAEQKEVQIAVSASPIPYVMADVEKISHVFSNLLSNAIKYTDKGGRIDVTISRHGRGARVAIKDNGIGIAPEDLPKIFTKFYQASNANKGSGKGTGLGLALVKAFVEGHGGSVSATSRLGAGSMFTVDLPPADLAALAHPQELRRKSSRVPA
jgi:signal transduction histidine kinase